MGQCVCCNPCKECYNMIYKSQPLPVNCKRKPGPGSLRLKCSDCVFEVMETKPGRLLLNLRDGSKIGQRKDTYLAPSKGCKIIDFKYKTDNQDMRQQMQDFLKNQPGQSNDNTGGCKSKWKVSRDLPRPYAVDNVWTSDYTFFRFYFPEYQWK